VLWVARHAYSKKTSPTSFSSACKNFRAQLRAEMDFRKSRFESAFYTGHFSSFAEELRLIAAWAFCEYERGELSAYRFLSGSYSMQFREATEAMRAEADVRGVAIHS